MRYLIILIFLFFPYTLHAQETKVQRLALLIGNMAYKGEIKSLKNPHNDVILISKALKSIGFKDVTVLKDLKREQMLEAFDIFADKVEKAGPNTVSFFYYSGHGAADRENTNYLIPINVKQLSNQKSWYSSVKLSEIIDRLNTRAPNASHYVIFDACRNTLRLKAPGTKRAIIHPKGFQAIGSGPGGMLIAYATAQGELASDEGEGSGPYAKRLASYLVRPDMEAVHMFWRMHKELLLEIKQKPWLHVGGNMTEFYFGGKLKRKLISNPDDELWAAVRNSLDINDFKRYLKAFPEGRYAETARVKIEKLQTDFNSNRINNQSEANEKVNTLMLVTETLQRELKRVGCEPGSIDGKWGEKGRKALSRFNKVTGLDLDIHIPTKYTVSKVANHKNIVCQNNDKIVSIGTGKESGEAETHQTKTLNSGIWLFSITFHNCYKLMLPRKFRVKIEKRKMVPVGDLLGTGSLSLNGKFNLHVRSLGGGSISDISGVIKGGRGFGKWRSFSPYSGTHTRNCSGKLSVLK